MELYTDSSEDEKIDRWSPVGKPFFGGTKIGDLHFPHIHNSAKSSSSSIVSGSSASSIPTATSSRRPKARTRKSAGLSSFMSSRGTNGSSSPTKSPRKSPTKQEPVLQEKKAIEPHTRQKKVISAILNNELSENGKHLKDDLIRNYMDDMAKPRSDSPVELAEASVSFLGTIAPNEDEDEEEDGNYEDEFDSEGESASGPQEPRKQTTLPVAVAMSPRALKRRGSLTVEIRSENSLVGTNELSPREKEKKPSPPLVKQKSLAHVRSSVMQALELLSSLKASSISAQNAFSTEDADPKTALPHITNPEPESTTDFLVAPLELPPPLLFPDLAPSTTVMMSSPTNSETPPTKIASAPQWTDDTAAWGSPRNEEDKGQQQQRDTSRNVVSRDWKSGSQDSRWALEAARKLEVYQRSRSKSNGFGDGTPRKRNPVVLPALMMKTTEY